MIEPEELMRIAIQRTREGIASGQSPFGCAIAISDEVVSAEHNTVWATTDITAHAEINALRSACKSQDQILLEGAVLATTCEPCPMCMTAIHWARVETVYFGATITDAERAGFNELQLFAAQIVAAGSKVKLVPRLLGDECRMLFDEWLSQEDRRSY